MKTTLVFPPMPVTISTADEAARLYGEGSLVHRVAAAALEDPTERIRRLHTCRECGCAVAAGMNGWCEDCRARDRVLESLRVAFRRVGECMALVEAHARSLHETDFDRDPRTITEWHLHAFGALGLLFERAPELLPFHDDGEFT